MSFLNKKKRWNKVVYSRITLGFILILCVLLAMSVYDRFSVERDMLERRTVAEEELQVLKNRKDSLEEKVNYLSGEQGIEAEIRKHFDVAREGEQVVVLVDNERVSKDDDLGESTELQEEHVSIWRKIFFWR